MERCWGAFSRTLTLPDGIDPDAVRANFDRGVLEVRIPRPEQRRPRRVEIAVGDGRPNTIDASAGPAGPEAGHDAEPDGAAA